MRHSSQNGSISIETALVLPFLVAVVISVSEAATMLHTYFTVQEAARVAARDAIRTGSVSNVDSLVSSITSELPPSSLQVSKSIDSVAKTATVEVRYAYQPSSGSGALLEALNNGPFTLASKVIMPLQ